MDSFDLNGRRYFVSKSHGKPFGCLGNICDYELGAIDSQGIAGGGDESIFRVCHKKPGTQAKYSCWKNEDAVIAMGRRILKATIPRRDRAELFARTVYHYDSSLLSDANVIREVGRYQRAMLSDQGHRLAAQGFGEVVGGLGGIGKPGATLGNEHASLVNMGDGRIGFSDAEGQWYETNFTDLPKGDWE